MKNRANKQGYIKVSDSLMLDELLESSTRSQLLQVHIDELLRTKKRNDKENYISKAQRQHLTTLYIDVVLNGKSYKPTFKVKQYSQKRGNLQHIGMVMYNNIINNSQC